MLLPKGHPCDKLNNCMRLADKQFPVKKLEFHTHYSLGTKLANKASQTYIDVHKRAAQYMKFSPMQDPGKRSNHIYIYIIAK